MDPEGATIRHAAGRLLVAAGAIAAAWSAVTLISGGFAVHAGPLALSSRDPLRPLLAAAVLIVAARLLLSRAQFGTAVGVVTGARHRVATRIAAAAAAGALVCSIAWTSGAAGGSDSSCYVLQAEAFARGRTTLSNPAASVLPDAPAAVFAPIGFVPSRAQRAEAVPICGPGLALVMAGAFVVHRDAVFLVVPVFAALLVWLTFVFGRRVDDEITGASAAVLMACSPTFLYQAVQPMSDVPAAAAWMAALVFAAGAKRRDTIAAGVAMSVAILIRPNLAPLVVPLLALTSFRLKAETSPSAEFRLKAETTEPRDSVRPKAETSEPRDSVRLKAETSEPKDSVRLKAETSEPKDSVRLKAEPTRTDLVVSAFRRNLAAGVVSAFRRNLVFVAAMAPGIAVFLVLNAARYGGPLATGYGDTGTLFSLGHLAPNAARYPRWLLETHTPLLLFALAAPWAISRDDGKRRLALVALAGSALIVATYLAYTVFEDWWYTRFLLPALPVLLGLSVAVVLKATEWLPPSAFARSASADRRSLGGGWFGGRSLRPPVAVILCLALAPWYLHQARVRHALDLQSLESRFAIAGRHATVALPASALVLSVQQSGSLRFHGGRDTIAWDAIPADALDRTIATIRSAGRAPFIVLEDAEEAAFRARFPTERFGRLEWPPQLEVHAPVRVRFYDPAALDRYLAGLRVDTAHVR